MKQLMITWLSSVLLLSISTTSTARQWTLKDCIDYALANNITLKKAKIKEYYSHEDIKQSQAELLPSLSFSTSHGVTYSPWPETGRAAVDNGFVQSMVNKAYYSGSYNLSANWTVWNGGRNTKTIKQNKLAAEQAKLDSAQTANSIQEQIAQLYVQILYSHDAINVNRENLSTSTKNENRGKEMFNVGKISKADLAQLTAQRAQDEYNVVEAESNLKNYKRQLKQLLQITDDDEFDVAIPEMTDAMALREIPNIGDVYAATLNIRPEIKNALIGIESSEMGIKIARAGRMPTIGLNAGISTSTSSMNDNRWGMQMKNNTSVGAGVTVSVPIFDNRASKTAINKMKLQKQNYMLDLRDKQTELYSTIENYWLQAMTNQNKYKAAKVSTESAAASYELLSEQFNQGMKNIVELMTGKNNLTLAQQNELQSKYLTILNIDMLNFYETGTLR